MKIKPFFGIPAFCLAVSAFTGCFFSVGTGDKSEIPQIDNSKDLKEYDVESAENEKYYTSSAIDLVTEIHGNYSTKRPFVLDENDETKRIYRDIYFYEGDFFQIIYYKDINKLGTIYAVMSDENDEEYAKIRYDGKKPLQIDIIKEGIYDLVFDTTTFGIDMQRKGDIETPVYETIKSCEIYIHNSASDYGYKKMTLDADTGDYYIETRMSCGTTIGFSSASHASRYYITLQDEIKDKYVYCDETTPTSAQVHIGGTYRVYFNSKTYVLRTELLDADTATYYCQVDFNKNGELTAKSASEPYIFEYDFTATGELGAYIEMPKFFPKLGMPYVLTVIDENELTYKKYVKQSGEYKLTVNLKDFTLTVEKI